MITQERLKEVLKYDPDSGLFTWLIDRRRARIGSIAGGKNHKGYIDIGIDGKHYRAHRLAVLYMEGYFPETTVDHENRIRDDNRWLNLREASQQCQLRNCWVSKNNTSGVKGLSWYRDKWWRARIKDDGRDHHLGYFSDKVEAACHRFAAEQCLGFQDCDTNSSARKFIESSAVGKG